MHGDDRDGDDVAADTELEMPPDVQPRYDNTDNHKIVKNVQRQIIIDNKDFKDTLSKFTRNCAVNLSTHSMGPLCSAAPGCQHSAPRAAPPPVSRHLGRAPPQLSVETRARRAELDGDWRHEHQVPHRPRSYGRRGTRGAVLLSSSISLLPLSLP